ncbi:DUF3775 domain-containing protein [Phenylobacterium sp.]|uniref:DUF3775 domain-containing protein n=1 Tax=Phenylobacterium sp. TaxID=1871053 RepID=UPI0039196275
MPAPQLTISPETAFFILLKAREFHAKVDEVDPDEGSNPTDDKAIDVLEFNPGDAVVDELVAAIDSLNRDEQLDLIALMWVGRGEFTLDTWDEAREGASRIDPEQIADYVLGLPEASDYLQEGLSLFGHSLSEFLNSGVAVPGQDVIQTP